MPADSANNPPSSPPPTPGDTFLPSGWNWPPDAPQTLDDDARAWAYLFAVRLEDLATRGRNLRDYLLGAFPPNYVAWIGLNVSRKMAGTCTDAWPRTFEFGSRGTWYVCLLLPVRLDAALDWFNVRGSYLGHVARFWGRWQGWPQVVCHMTFGLPPWVEIAVVPSEECTTLSVGAWPRELLTDDERARLAYP